MACGTCGIKLFCCVISGPGISIKNYYSMWNEVAQQKIDRPKFGYFEKKKLIKRGGKLNNKKSKNKMRGGKKERKKIGTEATAPKLN